MSIFKIFTGRRVGASIGQTEENTPGPKWRNATMQGLTPPPK